MGLDLPRLDVATKVLFIWFAAVALITLGMTETALFGSIGLLMWLIPVQAFLSVLFPIPAVIVLTRYTADTRCTWRAAFSCLLRTMRLR